MKEYGGVDVLIHIFLTAALVRGEWSASRPCRFTPGERAPGTHWVWGWVGPRAGLNDVEKRKFLTLPGLKLRLLRCPAQPVARPTPLSRLVAPFCSTVGYTSVRTIGSHAQFKPLFLYFVIKKIRHPLGLFLLPPSSRCRAIFCYDNAASMEYRRKLWLFTKESRYLP
jgi:hypothetical protein